MRKIASFVSSLAISIFIPFLLFTQATEPNPFDFGKMWTFENPPKAWFEEAYQFTPEDEWWDDVRKASLRFATWCSASFVSPNGLILTNHHCSRDEAIKIQQWDEQFESQGFYAEMIEDERKAPGLFVEQLIKVADITQEILESTQSAENEAQKRDFIQSTLEAIKVEYASKPGWEGLRTQTVSFYSGGTYSIYGYKRYDDIRLVFIPEQDIGFFGGDPDNFTYPRYNLDCTFWRIYDENGEPLDSEEFYFEFNPDGVKENEPVFVIGNPGSTERYRTMAQLEYDRDFRYPQEYKFMDNRYQFLQTIYEYNPSEELLGMMLNISNSMKATLGIIDGLHNDQLFNRKKQMEQKIRSESSHPEYWNQLAEYTRELHPHTWAYNHLSPVSLRGGTMMILHALHDYEQMIKDEESEEDLEQARTWIVQTGPELDNAIEKQLFEILITELAEDVYPGDETMQKLLEGKTVEQYIDKLFEETRFTNAEEAEKCLEKTKRVKRDKDPLLKAARLLIPKYLEARELFESSAPIRQSLESKIANETFKIYGNSLPPDATFTLRISDGRIRGYNYNGTIAPYKTTYFGLYDRHFSNDQNEPWELPEKWSNPSLELLKAPVNFVSTNDIIGGNSGSPVINREKQVIGLVFDGNIESLPGNFIFDEESNRTISVHAGGIVAALKYVFKADRLVNELVGIEEIK